jgi:hypothetical protein
MDPYTKNSACSCPRCRAGKLFFPAMIITIGVLFLADQNGYFEFDRSWPVILLVAGLFSYLSRAASLEGHVQPYAAVPGYPQQAYAQPGYAQPGYAQPGYSQATPPPAQTSGTGPQTGPTASTSNDHLHDDRPDDERSNNDPQVNS